MAFPALRVVREFSAEGLNKIVNHPEVRPWVGPGRHALDMSAAVADPRNILLTADGGAFLLIQIEPGRYEVHTQFLPEARGGNAVKAAIDGMRYLFCRTDCVEIVTRCPHGNDAAKQLVRHLRWEFQFSRPNVWATSQGMVGVDYYAHTLNSWVLRTDNLAEVGDWFHDRLEQAKIKAGASPLHDDDDAHDRYVGAAAEMIAHGQVAKGIQFYNRWARFAGYAEISVIAENPVVIDIQDALLAVRGNSFDVLLCR